MEPEKTQLKHSIYMYFNFFHLMFEVISYPILC